MNNLNKLVDTLFASKSIENIAIRVGIGDEIIADKYCSAYSNISDNTLFDIASVSKIVCTTSLLLIAFDRGLISPDTMVNKFYDVPDDKSGLTIKNLMTHTFGIGWKPLYEMSDSTDNIENVILNTALDIPLGSDVLYSCPAYILLGKILEKVFGDSLDSLFLKYVTIPLNMTRTSYLTNERVDVVNSNIEDTLIGTVNDYNCRYLGGVAGNAGVFSSVSDLTRYARFLLSNGQPLVSKETFNMAVKNYTPGMSESRGLGFLYVDKSYKQTGSLFNCGSIGHCGHTGQSLFVNLQNGLFVIILSDSTLCTIKKYGVDTYSDVIKMREDIHNAIYADLKLKGYKI